MTPSIPLAKLRVPLGGQEIELHEFELGAAADPGAAPTLPLLRTRIREGKRFTIFDIDPATARAWGEALLAWSDTAQARLAR